MRVQTCPYTIKPTRMVQTPQPAQTNRSGPKSINNTKSNSPTNNFNYQLNPLRPSKWFSPFNTGRKGICHGGGEWSMEMERGGRGWCICVEGGEEKVKEMRERGRDMCEEILLNPINAMWLICYIPWTYFPHDQARSLNSENQLLFSPLRSQLIKKIYYWSTNHYPLFKSLYISWTPFSI